jgi:hypothetical protein
MLHILVTLVILGAALVLGKHSPIFAIGALILGLILIVIAVTTSRKGRRS